MLRGLIFAFGACRFFCIVLMPFVESGFDKRVLDSKKPGFKNAPYVSLRLFWVFLCFCVWALKLASLYFGNLGRCRHSKTLQNTAYIVLGSKRICRSRF